MSFIKKINFEKLFYHLLGSTLFFTKMRWMDYKVKPERECKFGSSGDGRTFDI